MATRSRDRLMTAEDLLKLPDDGKHYELVRGMLICMSPSSIRPSSISGRVMVRVGSFVDQHHLGEYGTAEGGFKLASNPDTVRAPDVWFIRAERIPPDGLPEGFFPGAPDLAVEVLSPSDRPLEVMEKVRDYLDAGTRLVWVIDPEPGASAVFRADGSVTFLSDDGVLDGEDVLPGFSLPLRDVL